MERLTKRKENGIAYMSIADTLSKKDQIIEGSKPVLESLYAMFQKLAEFEDNQAELERLAEIGRATEFAMKDGSKNTAFSNGITYLLEFYNREKED